MTLAASDTVHAYRLPPLLPRKVATPVEDPFAARRKAVAVAMANQPLARVAALLVSISRNNGYEGRDPSLVPDTLTSGFVADLLGVDIATLASLLLDLRRRGLVEVATESTLRLRDLDGLEALIDAR